MSTEEYLETLKSIQANILTYIDREDHIEENYQNVIKIFDDQRICDNLHDIKLILKLISTVSLYHYRSVDFFQKFEKIILYFKTTLKKNFTNDEIFDLFERNNRMLLFLIREGIIIIDQSVYYKLESHYKSRLYFDQEIQTFLYEQRKLQKEKNSSNNDNKKSKNDDDDDEERAKEFFMSDDSDLAFSDIVSSDDSYIDEASYDESEQGEEIFEENEYNDTTEDNEENKENNNKYYSKSFYFKKEGDDKPPKKLDEIDEQKRSIGENDNEICELIRKDSIEEFIIYVKKNNTPLDSIIGESFFDTHPELFHVFFISLIKYAAFFGSIQIFKYLYLNGVKLDKSIWVYAIHGDNEEIIRILEDNKIALDDSTCEQCYVESIKCHNNSFAIYIENNYLSDEIKSQTRFLCLQYYNFELIPNEFDDISLHSLITLDYYTLLKKLLKDNYIDINQRINISGGSRPFRDFERHAKIDLETTALIISIDLLKLDFVQLILSHSNVDVNIRLISKYNNYSLYDNKMEYDFIKEKSPLQIAYEKKSMDIVHMLLSMPNIDVNNKYIKKKIKGIVVDDKLNQYDKNTEIKTIKNKSLLSIAISKNDVHFIKLLLANQNININIEDTKYFDLNNCLIKYTPLFKAIELKNIEIIQLLLSNPNIDVNCKFVRILNDEIITDKTPLYEALSTFENDQIFRLIFSNPKIDINAIITKRTMFHNIISKRTILYEAAREKNYEIVSLLLSNPNIDVNIKTINSDDANEFFSQKTVLYSAVKNRSIEIIKLLLNNPSIDVNFESFKSINNNASISKKSVLYVAVSKGELDVVEFLLKNPNIDVNSKSLKIHEFHKFGTRKTEKTILFKAVEKKKPELVKILISNDNIDVNKPSLLSISVNNEDDGDYIKCKTPLHEAVLKGCTEIIELLLSNEKVNQNVTDESKKRPVELTEDQKIISLFNK